MKVSLILPLLLLFTPLFAQQTDTLESKGAIIIASLEGQVVVTNNETQEQLPANQIKAGGLLFDGHTVKTGPASKVILLLSNGTVSTIKSDSALNIKKFTQEKFDPGRKKLSDMKGEPSSSQTVLDLELGDMVFDVKKLDKRSSFNIESPVGTAGIRGTSGQMGVMANNGSTNLNINMFKGSVATRLRGSDIATLVRQGQSFTAGISAAGVILPPTLGKVPTSLLASIEADLEASEGATGVTSVGDSSLPTGEGGENVEDEAPSEEELQEQDAEQAAASKGLGSDDNGSIEAVALDKAGVVDLDNPAQLERIETYVEATVGAAEMYAEKQVGESGISSDGAQRVRRNTDSNSKDSKSFLTDLVANLDEAVIVMDDQEKLGVKSEDLMQKTLENSENAPVTNQNMEKLRDAGVEDNTALQSLISEPANSDEAAEFIDEALKVDTTSGVSSAKTKLGAVARNTSVADKMKDAKDEGVDPATIIDSAVAVADLEIKAEQQQAVLVSSGPEVDPVLITEINNAPDEAALNAILAGKENESYYSKLEQLRDSRKEMLKLKSNKTKISTTIKAADSRNKSIATSKMEAEQLKGGIPVEVITALDIADISTSDKVTALKAEYEMDYKSDISTLDSINSYIDKLKSSFDLENKNLTSFVEDVDTLETIFTATEGDANFDISDSLVQLEDVAATYELLQTDGGTIDLEAAANLAKNANEIQESKKLLTAAKTEGIDLKTLAKKDIKEQKAINKAVADKNKKIEELRQDSEQSGLSPDLRNILDTADVSTDELAQSLKDQYSNDPSINGYIDSRRKSYKLENQSLSNFAETSQTLAVIYESTSGNEDIDITDSLAEIDEVQATFQLLSVDGEIDINNFDFESAANIAANADEIKESRKAIQRYKDAGVDPTKVTELARKDPDEQKAINDVFDKLEGAGGAAVANSFLSSGAADEAGKYEEALSQDSAGDLLATIVTAVSTSGTGTDSEPIDFKAEIEKTVQNSAFDKLKSKYSDNPTFVEIIQKNEVLSQDISFALSFINTDTDEGVVQEQALFANIDKLDSIISLGSRFKDDTDQLASVFGNLDHANVLNELVNEFKNQPSRITLILENPELSPAVLSAYKDFESTGSNALISDLFASTESMKETLSNDGINKLRQDYPAYESEISTYKERAGEIKSLLEQMDGNTDRETFILENLEDFDAIRGLSTRFQESEEKLSTVFNYQGNLNDIREVSDKIKVANLIGGQDFLFNNLDHIDVLKVEDAPIKTFIDLADKYDEKPENMDVIFAHPEKALLLNDLATNLDTRKDDILSNIDQIDVISDLSVAFKDDLSKLDIVFGNPEKAGDILNLSNRFPTKQDEILSAVNNIEEVESLANRFEGDDDKIETLFDNVDRVVDIKTLADKFDEAAADGVEVKPEDVLDNLQHLDDFLALDQKFEGDEGKLMNLYLNPEKAGSLKGLIDRYDEQAEDLIFKLDSLDSIEAIEEQLDGDAAMMEILLANPDKSNDLKSLSDRIGGKADKLLENVEQLDVIGELADTYSSDSDKMDIIFANPTKASKLRNLSKDLSGQEQDLLDNIDQIDVIGDLVIDYAGDPEKMDIIFRNPSKASKLRDLNDRSDFEGQSDDLLSNIDHVGIFDNEPKLLGFAKDHPEFFELLLTVGDELNIKIEDIEFSLLTQLVELSLTRDELHKVLSDLDIGPDSEGPADQPPSSDELDEQLNGVSLLESHDFSGEIPSDLVLREEQVRASNLFQETLDIFDALSLMDQDSSSNTASSPSSTSTELPMGIIGGVNLKFSSGDYDLSYLGYLSYAIAGSDTLTIEGSLSFSGTSQLDELFFISGSSIELAEGSSVDFRGRQLSLGSFNSLEVINVDLHADDEIGLRSLDSIVINNSEFVTRGNGADKIHLIAAADLAVDNLRFSEQIRQITMEAMTINLKNLNFPAGSSVNLNSAYGGIEGLYPNFGSSAVGRVNFIQNVKYNSHLLNSRSTFDAYGTSITIGTIGN